MLQKIKKEKKKILIKKKKTKQKKKEKVNIITKTPNTAKNIFYKNLKLFKEQNKLWLFNKSKIDIILIIKKQINHQ